MGKPGRKPGYHHTEKAKRKISQGHQKHGVFALVSGLKKGKKVIDRRTQVGKAVYRAIEELVKDLGGEAQISQSQRLLLDRIKEKLAIMALINKEIAARGKVVRDDGELIPLLKFNYLTWSAELRRDLQALQGLGKGKAGGLDYRKYVRDLKGVDRGEASAGENSG